MKCIQQRCTTLHSAETQVALRTQKSRQFCCFVPNHVGNGQAPPAAESRCRIQRGEQLLLSVGVDDVVFLVAEHNQHTEKQEAQQSPKDCAMRRVS